MTEHRSWRQMLAIGGLLALVAVVGVAAAGHAPAAGDNRPSTHAPTLLVQYVGTIALLFVPAGVILIFWTAFAQRAEELRTKKKHRSPAASLLIFVVLAGVAFGLRSHFQSDAKQPGRPLVTHPKKAKKTAEKEKQTEAPKPAEGHFRWEAALVVGSLLFTLAAVAGAYAWRRRYGVLPERTVAAMLADVLAETLDDLRNEPDPRKAVIGAYAKMERTMAARGVPRHAFEAPLEYLARLLGIVQASAHSVARLTKLFERARFSPHEIDARMKDDAIDALAGLRAELEVAR